jgi:hypothetical protein
MNNAYIPALAALAGSAIGALASFATTWLTQHSQERAQRYAQAMTLREQLYGGFIEEASKLFTDALTHELGDPSKFVALYALIAKLRLFASPRVIASAEQVMRRIVETYNLPNRDYRKPVEVEEQPEQDLLRGFSEACRADLHV